MLGRVGFFNLGDCNTISRNREIILIVFFGFFLGEGVDLFSISGEPSLLALTDKLRQRRGKKKKERN